MLVPTMRLLPERQAPLVAQHKAVPGVEQRASSFRGKIERVLSQVILSGNRLGRRTGHVERGSIVDGFRIRVRREKRNPMTESLRQARLQGVVGRIGDAFNQTG